MLKSLGCDTMTGTGGSLSGRSSEPRERNGLGRSNPDRCTPLGKTSRNMNEGRRTTASGKSQARLDGVAATVGSFPWTRWTSCRRARGTHICAAAPEQNYVAVDISEKREIPLEEYLLQLLTVHVTGGTAGFRSPLATDTGDRPWV